jgi:hypothetical protein
MLLRDIVFLFSYPKCKKRRAPGAKNAQSARDRTFRILTLWAKEVNDIQR